MTKLTGFTFPLDPQICLLGNFTTSNAHLRNLQKKFLTVALCIARKCIAIPWKSDSHLPIARWLYEMKTCIPLESITYALRNEYNILLKIWQLCLAYGYFADSYSRPNLNQYATGHQDKLYCLFTLPLFSFCFIY